MKTNIFKHAVVLLILAVSFTTCDWENHPGNEEKVITSSCDDLQSLMRHYPSSYGNPPWIFEMIGEWLENGIYGSIILCDYRDGRGYSFEPHEVRDDFKYSFRNCEGGIVYEGMKNPIDACPELNIEYKLLFMSSYPSWDRGNEGTSDEFPCHAINPFTLPRVKEMLYHCSVYRCEKMVSICTYRDGVGFLLEQHINAGKGYNADFLDCSGNLLCNVSKSGESSLSPCPELNIDIRNQKIILILNVSLSYPNQ